MDGRCRRSGWARASLIVVDDAALGDLVGDPKNSILLRLVVHLGKSGLNIITIDAPADNSCGATGINLGRVLLGLW